MDFQEYLQPLWAAIKELSNRRVGKNNLIPGSIEQRHMAANTIVIQIGLASSRPTAGSNAVQGWLSSDTHVLSLWDGTIWRTVTLT